MALEDEYSVEIPAEDLEQLTTVGEVIDVYKRQGDEVASSIRSISSGFTPAFSSALIEIGRASCRERV